MLPDCLLYLECLPENKENQRPMEIAAFSEPEVGSVHPGPPGAPRKPINIGLPLAPSTPRDSYLRRAPTPTPLVESEDNWNRVREAWFTTRSSSEQQNPYAGEAFQNCSPSATWSLPDPMPQENMSGKRRHESENRLNGETRYPLDGTLPMTGKQYVKVPKLEASNLFPQIYMLDIILHSDELAQILYNLLSERLAVNLFNLVKVFWGDTGSGKSHTAWEEAGVAAYSKDPTTKWWDGYSVNLFNLGSSSCYPR